MFQQRVGIVVVVLVAALGLLAIRLIELQVVNADEYRKQAADALLLQPETLPFVRGAILDRNGRVLASDEPGWQITVDYGALRTVMPQGRDSGYIDARARKLGRSGRFGQGLTEAQIEEKLLAEINQAWSRLAAFSGKPEWEVRDEARQICDRVQRIHDLVARRRGFDAPVEEEVIPHPLITGLDDQQQVAARERFADQPWIHIESVTQRHYWEAECLAHVLGRTAAVDAELIDRDPFANDDLRRYKGNETAGRTGIEHAAEARLRGKRGKFHENLKGEVLEDVPPEPGQDVRLTISYDLQERLYRLLESQVPRYQFTNGGAIVVLDVATRDVLALVSYPSYDPNLFNQVYTHLQRDTERMPLRFRSVSNQYNPGSIIKPLTCLAGLANGVIDLHSTYDCTGYLFPENPSAGASKCWAISGSEQRMAHGPVDVAAALQGSCNVFMYHVGAELGVERLCDSFQWVGLGESTGIGLPMHEVWGINPRTEFLESIGQPPTTASPRSFAIGQSELMVTPIQAANLFATYAEGLYRQVHLYDDCVERFASKLPISAAAWDEIHRGLYGVVNHPEGTAYKYARFTNDRYALCGKTGSATTKPIPTSFRIAYNDPELGPTFTVLPAGDRNQAIEVFKDLHPGAKVDSNNVTVQDEWPRSMPPGGGRHAHAWFGGYLQPLDARGEPDFTRPAPLAFAVLAEFGGSGGRVSGPIAAEVAQVLVDYLEAGTKPEAGIEPRLTEPWHTSANQQD
jgi:penicillin-binding protein 2